MAQRLRRGVPQEPEGEPELQVPRSQMDQELEARITQGRELLEQAESSSAAARAQPSTWPPREGGYRALRDRYYTWNDYNEQLLRSRFSTGKLADEYTGILMPLGGDTEWEKLVDLGRDFNRQIRKLESIRERLGLFKSVEGPTSRDGSVTSHAGDKIFIVHGHDGDIKQQVARFIEQITGERPIILHEQADFGRTTIEKFEAHASDAGFAIILLTADDEGGVKGAADLNSRARQNVVFEFGYLMAKLGRDHVVALYEKGVELPSDVSGLLYKELTGNWKMELAAEISAVGIEIDLRKALR